MTLARTVAERDGDLTVLTMGAARHLGFLKVHNFNCRYGSTGQYMRQLVTFRAKRSNRCGHMVVFRFFKMAVVIALNFVVIGAVVLVICKF